MKLNQNATHIKIPLDSVRETGNVRRAYDEDGIRELAESIKHNGLLNPVTVKPAEEDADGNKTYELIAGYRRIRAYRYLCEQGDDFSMIEACIRTGKKLILQIIENIQRADITPREKEDAIAQMLAENYTQTDIAAELSKPIQWVSDIVAGAKVRKVADAAYLDTENIATKTLSQLRTIPESELTEYLTQLVMRGGTMKAATDILHEWKAAPIHQLREHQEEMRQLAEKMLTTNERSGEDSEEKSEIDEQIEGMFKDEANDIAYSDDESTIEPHELTEAEWEDEVRRYDNAFAEAVGRKTPEQLADEALAPQSKTEPKPPKKPDSFNIYVHPSDPNGMMSAVGRLSMYMRNLPLDTKICVQAGSKVAEISSVIYEPGENRLTFRCLEDFGIR